MDYGLRNKKPKLSQSIGLFFPAAHFENFTIETQKTRIKRA